MADLDSLKADIDKLGDLVRKSEKDIYDRINSDASKVAELNTSVKLVIEQISTFIDTFKSHDSREMEKYGKIEEMFETVNTRLQDKYVTKKDFDESNNKIKEISDAVKQGFKIFYIGCGVFLSITAIGGLLLWIINLMDKINKLGGS